MKTNKVSQQYKKQVLKILKGKKILLVLQVNWV